MVRGTGFELWRMACLGVDLRPVSRPVVGIAMCKTPMHCYTHGRSGLFKDGQWMLLGRWSRDDATGDPVAGVAGGVGLHVVGLLMDDDGGAAVGDDAVRRGGI